MQHGLQLMVLLISFELILIGIYLHISKLKSNVYQGLLHGSIIYGSGPMPSWHVGIALIALDLAELWMLSDGPIC
jgi:hypothetical protein